MSKINSKIQHIQHIQHIQGLIQTMLNDNTYDSTDILTIIDTSNNIFTHDFIEALNNIMLILLSDKQHNIFFDIAYLKIFIDNFNISRYIIDIIVAHGHKLNTQITYDIIYKCFIYLFFILIPKNTNVYFNNQELNTLFDIVNNIYSMIKVSKTLEQSQAKININVKNNVFCCCFFTDKHDKLDEIIARKSIKLDNCVIAYKEQMLMKKDIYMIKDQLGLNAN